MLLSESLIKNSNNLDARLAGVFGTFTTSSTTDSNTATTTTTTTKNKKESNKINEKEQPSKKSTIIEKKRKLNESNNTNSKLSSTKSVDNLQEKETTTSSNADTNSENIVQAQVKSHENEEESSSFPAKKQRLENDKIKKEKNPSSIKKESPERLERTVFVGNISIQVTKKEYLSQFKQLFMPCGPIESIRFRSIPMSKPMQRKIAFIQKEFNTHRDSMNAYVVFKSKESVDQALTLNATLFLDKHLRLDRCAEQKEERGKYKRCIFVGNLDFSVENEIVHQHFKECGPVEYVRIIRDRATNMGKGFGYVCFKDRAAIDLALQLDGQKLNGTGRELRISRCSRKDVDQNKRSKKSGYESRKREAVKLKSKKKTKPRKN